MPPSRIGCIFVFISIPFRFGAAIFPPPLPPPPPALPRPPRQIATRLTALNAFVQLYFAPEYQADVNNRTILYLNRTYDYVYLPITIRNNEYTIRAQINREYHQGFTEIEQFGRDDWIPRTSLISRMELFPYLGTITSNSDANNVGSVYGYLHQDIPGIFGPNSAGAYIFYCVIELMNGETYYIEPLSKYCVDTDVCQDSMYNAVIYNTKDVNIMYSNMLSCQHRGLCDLGDFMVEKEEGPPRPRQSNDGLGFRHAEKNIPRACRIQVLADYSVYRLFHNNIETTVAKLRQYITLASDMFRKHDFNGDGYRDDVRISPVVFRVFTDPNVTRSQGVNFESLSTQYRDLKTFYENEFNLYKQMKPYCAVVLFVARRELEDHDMMISYRGPHSGEERGGACVRGNDGSTLLNGGILSLMRSGAPIPDSTVPYLLLHLFGHMFGATHRNETRCGFADLPSLEDTAMSRIQVDGSVPESHSKFSECSMQEIFDTITTWMDPYCLDDESYLYCGNSYKERWEDCDCSEFSWSCRPTEQICCTKWSNDMWEIERPCELIENIEQNCTRKFKETCCNSDCTFNQNACNDPLEVRQSYPNFESLRCSVDNMTCPGDSLICVCTEEGPDPDEARVEDTTVITTTLKPNDAWRHLPNNVVLALILHLLNSNQSRIAV